MQAINPADPKEVDVLRCINCFRCICSCPRKAKFMDNEKFNDFLPVLEALTAIRKEPEIFI
jgi:ferredoxin